MPLPDVSAAVAVGEPSQVGEARRAVAAAARRLGFGETDAGNAAIVATEAATNLLKHAGGGQVLVRALQHPDTDELPTRGLEILALDRGPGIRDLAECLRDGYTTTGTLGTGLGAIQRLSSTFDIYSAPGLGTALLSQLFPSRGERRPGLPAAEVGAVCVASPGEEAPGDGFAFRPLPDGFRLLVADGLGHGPLAREAAAAAVAAFDAHPDAPPAALLELCHGALKATRGAAVAVAEADFAAGSVRFAGIGNVAGAILGERGSQSMVSMNGIVGQGVIKARELTYAWTAGSLLVMCSDGLTTRWSLDAYPGLVARHPSLVTGVLYRDHARGRDDATAVAVRQRRREPPA